MITRILSLSLIYQIFGLCKDLYDYIKESHTIGKVFHSTEFGEILKKYLHVDFDEDWLGRLYGVINPLIDIDGKANFNNQIIEINGDNTNNTDFVKSFLYKQLSLVSDLFRFEGLYNYIIMDVKHVGPINADNYLIVFDTIGRKKLSQRFKRVASQSIFYIIIAAIVVFAIL